MEANKMFINNEWVPSTGQETRDIINPSTEEVIGKLSLGSKEDVDKAVASAKAAFDGWNRLGPGQRAKYLGALADGIERRKEEILEAIIRELGTSRSFAKYAQVQMGIDEIRGSLEVLDEIEFEKNLDNALVVKEGFGVVAAINPWNFPLNQIQRKITSALLAGNTVVVKPASETPTPGLILAEIVQEVGFPKGVFNLVTGSGSGLGDYLASHKDVSVISFTGSTEVGKGLFDKAKETVKHLVLELGGKSALILMEDGDMDLAIETSVNTIINNSGQVCTALTRLLVPRKLLEEVEKRARAYVATRVQGDPGDDKTHIGPVVSEKQMERVLEYIKIGKEEGARLIAGGTRKDCRGYFIEPTIFTDVSNDMRIAREEIFGPVLSIIAYDDLDQAVAIANDSPYGLSGAVVGPEDKALDLARRLRTGAVLINGASHNVYAPFGGYKESGFGRERGVYGIEDYLEVKGIYR